MTLCTSTLANGEPCRAPAVNNTCTCRHHDPNRPRRQRCRESQPLQLPPLVNKAGILSAITQVLHAVSERRMKRDEGATLLFGLQMAGRIMTELDETVPTNYSDELYETTPAGHLQPLPVSSPAQPEPAATLVQPEPAARPVPPRPLSIAVPVPEPAQIVKGIAELGEMRRKLEAEGHVFYTPTPQDEKEMRPLFDQDKIQEYAELYLAKQEAWERKHRFSKPSAIPSAPHFVCAPHGSSSPQSIATAAIAASNKNAAHLRPSNAQWSISTAKTGS